MGNTAVKGYTDVWGKHGAAIYDHTGPASYVTGGEKLTPQSLGLRNIDWVEPMRSASGAIVVIALSPAGNGGNATSIILQWQFTTTGSIASVGTGTAGSGMTPGVTVPLVFPAPGAGGVQATGTLTVLTATTFSTIITNPGSGYSGSVVPTVTLAGTAPILTATLSTVGAQPAAGTNLSGISVRLLAIGG